VVNLPLEDNSNGEIKLSINAISIAYFAILLKSDVFIKAFAEENLDEILIPVLFLIIKAFTVGTLVAILISVFFLNYYFK